MGLVRGIAHVHSHFSYDGVHSLDELAAFGRRSGYGFIAMSEHSETLDPETMAVYVKECQRVSGDDLVVIPGIEFACEGNLHVLALGLGEYTNLTHPVRVAEFVRERHGVAVVAHPSRYRYRIPSILAPVLGGIEIWNAGCDGRFVPNDGSLNLLREFRKQNESIMAFAGQDLHRLEGRCRVHLAVRADRLDGATIVAALGRGEFAIGNGVFRLDACHGPGSLRRRQLAIARRMYEGAKRVRDGLQAWRGGRAGHATGRAAERPLGSGR
jgi:hypothetical protein